MIFNYIRLKNFRQYKDDIKVEFSTSEDNPITLVIAQNGVGKTTFLQAFRYCFYGAMQNSKIVNLPNSNELLNNQIINEATNNEEVTLSVEVGFEHQEERYVMRREDRYRKHGDKMIKSTERSRSTLSHMTKYEGAKTYNNVQADLKMASMLPAGLSNIFMFDGERVERNLEEKAFKDDLKLTISGMLDLEKYDRLINHLGHIGNSRSVLGKLHSEITTSNIDQGTEMRKLSQLSERAEQLDNEIEIINRDIEAEMIKIERLEKHHSQVEVSSKNKLEREELRSELQTVETEIEGYASEVVKLGTKALLYKELLKVSQDFKRFVQSKKEDTNFYSQLHVDTIMEILERRECICGETIIPDGYQEHNLKKLIETALPESKSQYLSFIQSQRFNHASEFNEVTNKISKLISNIYSLSGRKQDLLVRIEHIEKIIERDSSASGEDYRVLLNSIERKGEMDQRLGELTTRLNSVRREEENQRRVCRPILESNEQNQKYSFAIDNVQRILDYLKTMKETKDKEARNILTKHFNYLISEIMNGNYSTSIDDKYNISIYNNLTENDDTSVLSTGQNVVVSLSFVMALIETAKALSIGMKSGEKYGVIMDAALSNLDETHTSAVTSNSLNKMDQLIFLSFKRQLRDEMFNSLKNKVGKAYEFSVADNGSVKSTQLELTNLEEYIHLVEEA